MYLVDLIRGDSVATIAASSVSCKEMSRSENFQTADQ